MLADNVLMSQLDYLFFIHGLSFILLGTVCLALNRKMVRLLPWVFLAHFALLQGIQGWMELYFLDLFNPSGVIYLRLGVLLISNIFLFEFVRRSSRLNGGPKWPAWSILPLLAGALSGLYWQDASTLEVTIRFALGLPAGVGACLVLLWRARQVTSAARRGLLGAAFCFACYTLSSGLVPRVAEFLPIESLHYQAFLNALGFPVHLFWIGTAVGTSVGLWVYNIHSTSRDQDLRVSSLRRRFGGYVAGVLCVIAVVGWSGTERLGVWGLNQDLTHGKSAAAYTEAIFMRAVTTARGLAISLSQSPEIREIFVGPVPQVSEDSRAALDRRSIVVPGSVCYVLNLEGMVLDATNRGTPESWVGETFASRRYFQEALLGHPSEYLAMGLLTHLPAFFASHPIFDPDGRVVGVVVIRSLLSTLNLFPEDGPSVLFVDSHGVVMESPQQRYNSRALWPLTPEAQQAALDSGQHRTIDFTPFLEREVEDREVCVVEGRLKAVVRRLLPTQGYSLLVLCNLSHLPLFRLIAISMTLLASVGTLAFAFGRQKDIESLWALEASQRRYRGLVESSQNLIFLFDASGRCQAANSVARSMLDVSEETLLSRHFLDLMWPDSVCPEVEKALAQVLEGHLVRFDAQAIPCGDTAKDLLVALSPILDFQGVVERFVCIATDITEQKRIERALRDSEERFRQIALNMGDWVFELDENQVYTYCSPRIHDILGYVPEELIGKRILDQQNPEEAQRLREALVKPVWVKQQSLFDTEFTLHHKNGSARNLLFSLSPYFSESGKFLGVRGVVKDITAYREAEAQRRQMETRLLQSQKLDSLSVMAGSIAHNFNNLMQVVQGNHDLALRQTPMNEKVASFLREADKAARRASELSSLMLTYVGQSGGVSVPLALNSLATGMDAVITGILPQHVRFEMRLDPALPKMMGDPAQLQQIILNLVTNSVEAIGANPGRITLTTGLMECDAAYLWRAYLGENLKPGRYLFLEISDTGIGMETDTAARIFEPFYSTKFTGRGLGLPAVVGIMRTHRGALSLETAPGKGTRMRLLFPAVEESSSPPAPVPPVSPNLSLSAPASVPEVFTVLIVDDDPGVLDVATEVIRSVLGYEALRADNGREAIRIVQEGPTAVSCVLLDMTMPDLSGADVLRKIREIQPNLPVVMVSGYLEEEVEESLSGLKIQGFLQKPFTMSSLSKTLVLIRESQASSA